MLPKMKYADRPVKKQCVRFSGLNLTGGAGDGELSACKNLSALEYPSLAPRSGRAACGSYQNPGSMFAWNGLAVMDGSTLWYRGERVGELSEGEKQFAVVGGKLCVFPDKVCLDPDGGGLMTLCPSVTTVAGGASFAAAGHLTLNFSPTLGSVSCVRRFEGGEHYINVCSSVTFAGGAWTKQGEAVKKLGGAPGEATLAVGDKFIPALTASGGLLPVVKERARGAAAPVSADFHAEENAVGYYAVVTAVTDELVYSTSGVVKQESGRSRFRLFHLGGDCWVSICSSASRSNGNGWTKTGARVVKLQELAVGDVFIPEQGDLRSKMYFPVYRRTSCGAAAPALAELEAEENDGGVYCVLTAVDKDFVYSDAFGLFGHIRLTFDVYKSGAPGLYGVKTIAFDAVALGESGKLSSRFAVGDVVEVSGCVTNTTNNKKNLVISAIDDANKKLVFLNTGFQTQTEAGSVTVGRSVPDMDFICECGNRLWGVSSAARKIYASAPGRPERFGYFTSDESSCYEAEVASDGVFTGMCAYDDEVLCWKENGMHRVGGRTPRTFEVSERSVPGVQAGCSRSLRVVNSVLYYKSRGGVYAYRGGAPKLVSLELGSGKHYSASAGTDGRRLFICMKDEENEWSVFTYDPVNSLWLREDDSRVNDFALSEGVLYMARGGEVSAVDAGGTEAVSWEAEFAPFREERFGDKDYKWLRLRLELDEDAEASAWLALDGGGFKEYWKSSGTGAQCVSVPVGSARCDRLRVLLCGKGKCRLLGVEREYQE